MARTVLAGASMLRLSAIAFTALTLTTTACDGDDPSLGSQDADVEEGGACEYAGPANDRYKEAVATAKAWKAEECRALSTEAIALAQEAVEMCAGVGPLIADSEWAGALREALGPLEVAHLAGDLAGDDGGLSVKAVGRALDGQTLWAPGQGAYGPPRIVHLGAGSYELERLVTEDEGVTIERKVTSRGTWAAASDGSGGVLVAFDPEDGAGEEEQLGEVRLERWSREGLELFRFVPSDGSLDEWGTNALYAANISECDA